MFKYICKRLGYMVFVFLILTILFFALFTSVPGDPAMKEVAPLQATVSAERFQELYQMARVRHGLDDPLPIRYAKWLSRLLQGDLGYSTFFQKDVAEVLPTPMKNTVLINLFNVFFVMAITIPLGIHCAIKKNSFSDRATQILTIVGYSTPVFVLALLSIFIFSVKLGWFPVSGWTTAGKEFTGKWDEFKDVLYHLVVPLFVMTISSLGGMTRYVRAAMIDALGTDYIRTARAKGLKEKVVIYSHAWRNALLPVITLIFNWFIRIFSGSIIIESTFNLMGMGRTYILALSNQDYTLAMAIQLFYVIISLIGNLVIDLSYGLVDPRVRITK